MKPRLFHSWVHHVTGVDNKTPLPSGMNDRRKGLMGNCPLDVEIYYLLRGECFKHDDGAGEIDSVFIINSALCEYFTRLGYSLSPETQERWMA